MEETLRSLVEFVKTASPLVWDAVLRQVYVTAVTNFIWLLALVVGLVVLVKISLHCRRNYVVAEAYTLDGWDRSDWATTMAITMGGAVIVIVAILIGLTETISRLLNPNYYAIQMILQNLK